MAELREMWQNFCPIKAVIINGDLTAFGHHDELATFETLLEEARLKLGIPFYMGLGNHDYANNVDDCYDNNCAQRMVRLGTSSLEFQKHTNRPDWSFLQKTYDEELISQALNN
uniref:Calcineurin-like phosphoesterase domain-containing protein n=1 Tax=Romanomermis culicivorax TaxID=13658 RepID=A0A915HZB0_ROMCU